MDDPKIISIIPADGWSAVYLETKPPGFILCPLVCWALVEDPCGDRRIAGMDGWDYVDYVNETSNFYCYVHSGQITNEIKMSWVKAAQDEIEKDMRILRHIRSDIKERAANAGDPRSAQKEKT